MSPVNLTTLLAAEAKDETQQAGPCPDEHMIAGYVDGALDAPACEELERHLAECGRCLSLVGLLSRERRAGAIETVPDVILAQARALVTVVPQRRWQSAPRWAAAASVILAVPLLMQISRTERGIEGQGRPEPSATRTVVAPVAGLRVLSPAAGTTVDPRRLSFRWSEVPGSPYYDVRIVTDAGDIVAEQRVTGTDWRPPARLMLHSGDEYFVHVDAYPSGDRAVSSEHVPFRIGD